MSKLTWLHISDLHFRAPQNNDFRIMRKALLRDVDELAAKESLIPDFIVVTGDLAFAGQREEYALVQEYFDKLLEATGVSKDRIFVIPGNHDVDRSAITPGATSIVESLYTRDRVNEFLDSEEDRALVFRKFRHYRDFISDYFGDDEEQYFYVKRLELSGKHIAVLGLNSAWASGIAESDAGYLLIGERQVREALEASEGVDLRLALVHHPLQFLSDFDRRKVTPLLFGNCDFVLHGFMPPGGPTLSYVHGFMPPGGPTLSYDTYARAIIIGTGRGYSTPADIYNFVQLDFDSNECSIYSWRYDQPLNSWATDSSTHPEAPEGTHRFPLRLDWSPPTEESADSVPVPAKVCVNELCLTNFRCFEEESFQFSEEFTVLIGNNASGKTAILEALKIGIGAFFLGMEGASPPSFESDQARLLQYRHGEMSTNESQYPIQVQCSGIWVGQELKWTRKQEGLGDAVLKRGAEKLIDLAKSLETQVRKGADVTLPLIAYYNTGRLWRVPKRSSSNVDAVLSRFKGYESCLDRASHIGDIMGWMRTQELIVLQERKPSWVYEAVKDAIKDCLGNVTAITYNVRADEVSARFSDGREFPFRMLSGGVRNMFGMVADIARRAAILNPQFGEKAPSQTPGIVLIDEIDLHLHPSWQRRVVDDLRRTFPRIQFIATTHSPFIIQSLRQGELVDLEKDTTNGNYVERSIEDIVEDVMGIEVPQRSKRFQQMFEAAEKYYKVLQEAEGASPEKKRELEQRLDELTEPFSDDVAYHAFLKMERIAAGLGEGDDETS